MIINSANISNVSNANYMRMASPDIVAPTPPSQWFAIHTRSRHEKMLVAQLREQGIETAMPTSTELRRWSDRQKRVEFPLFPGYVFVRVAAVAAERVRVLRTPGAVGFVGAKGIGEPIPDAEMDAVLRIASAKVQAQAHPYLKVGQRVRIRGGALDGVEGVLTATSGEQSLVISVAPIERAISIRVSGYEVEPI